jgi:NTE family protein
MAKATLPATDLIGLALGGGAVLGAAHIGVLRALDELDIEIAMVSGTSIGALIGSLYAFGMDWRAIRDVAVDLDWLDLSRPSWSQYGMVSNSRIGKLVHDCVGAVDIEDAQRPLAIVATDIATGDKVVLRHGPVARAVTASTCIPGIFIPVECEDRLLVDGGIVENVPILSLKEMEAGYVIGVDLYARPGLGHPKNLVQVLINTVSIALHHATRLQTEHADLLLQPDLSKFNLYDLDQVPALIEHGYRSAMHALTQQTQ